MRKPTITAAASTVRFFPVRYMWTDAKGQKRYGHSVVSGPTEKVARQRFALENPHVLILP